MVSRGAILGIRGAKLDPKGLILMLIRGRNLRYVFGVQFISIGGADLGILYAKRCHFGMKEVEQSKGQDSVTQERLELDTSHSVRLKIWKNCTAKFFSCVSLILVTSYFF